MRVKSFFERWRGTYDGGKSAQVITYFNALLGWSNTISKFEPCKSYQLALTLSEVFNPIDAIADRASSIPYVIVGDDGTPVTLSSNQSKLLSQPNITQPRLSDLIYAIVFSELADGNSYVLTKTNSKTENPDMISSIWALAPDTVSIKYKGSTPSLFNITDKSDFIEHYKSTLSRELMDPEHIVHSTSMFLRNSVTAELHGQSPLVAVSRNINNLLAVYQARYKVYANNGMAGILSRQYAPANGGIESAISPPTRKDIVDDLNNNYGLTGDKKILGVSSVPVQFIKTIASIRELQPFEETEADAIAIAGVYNVDQELIPKKGGTTFTNKKAAEISLWQNVVMGVCADVAKTLDKAFMLPAGQHFKPLFDDVAVLQEDLKLRLESDRLMIDNVIAINNGGLEANPIAKKILESYDKAE